MPYCSSLKRKILLKKTRNGEKKTTKKTLNINFISEIGDIMNSNYFWSSTTRSRIKKDWKPELMLERRKLKQNCVYCYGKKTFLNTIEAGIEGSQDFTYNKLFFIMSV